MRAHLVQVYNLLGRPAASLAQVYSAYEFSAFLPPMSNEKEAHLLMSCFSVAIVQGLFTKRIRLSVSVSGSVTTRLGTA